MLDMVRLLIGRIFRRFSCAADVSRVFFSLYPPEFSQYVRM